MLRNAANLYRYLIASVLLVVNLNLNAQTDLGGTITYQLTTKYTFPPTGKPEWDEYAKTLPTERRTDKVLYFNSIASLFKEPGGEKEALSIKEQKAMYMADYGKAPRPEMKQIYCDFSNNRKAELQNFMSRDFIVESDIPVKKWKLNNNRLKILDYTCMEAVQIMGTDTIKAWFTPEIPISAGPAEYYGLPGIILAVERKGTTIYLASSISLDTSEEKVLLEPNLGRKVSQKQFDKIVAEKTEEWKTTLSQKGEKSNYSKQSKN